MIDVYELCRYPGESNKRGAAAKNIMLEKDKWTIKDWVRRLKEQAEETKEYRHRLYEKVEVKTKRDILDAGCGTGVITADIASLTTGDVIGIDIDSEKLEQAKILVSDSVTLLEADVLQLPFKDETFDLVIFSVLLIYIKNQQRAVNEMARVTKKNGIVLATTEPDYAGAIFYPENEMYSLFLKDLEEMGADFCTGRKLRSLFSKAGLQTEIGLHTEYFDMMNKDTKEQVTLFLDHFWFTEKLLRKHNWIDEEIETYKQERVQLIETNQLFYYLPTFYAIGKKCGISQEKG